MPGAAEYEAQIKELDWARLRDLWSAIIRRDTPGWEPGKAFEYLVLRAFELAGADVTWPYSVKLLSEQVEQIDGAIHCRGLMALVESKDVDGNVAFTPIAKLRNQLLRRPSGTIGVMFSSRDFTEPAKLLAAFALPQAILLWSGNEIELARTHENIAELLVRKHRVCVEHGVPDYNITQREIR